MVKIETNAFLDGRLQILQPSAGYRAATDAVFLAAFVRAESGQKILDIGCGVGVALLALGSRVENLELCGLEREEEIAKLAQENSFANQIPLEIFNGDLATPPATLKEKTFDIVLTNPPFHKDGPARQNPHKQSAHAESLTLDTWITASLKRLKSRGHFYMIHRAARLPDILTSLHGCGDITILPIAPRAGREANRVLIRARKDTKGETKLCAPFIVHKGEAHKKDGENYTAQANTILRDGKALTCP